MPSSQRVRSYVLPLFRKFIAGFLILFLTLPKSNFAEVSADAGGKLFKQYCTSCHSINNKLVGPPLKGIYEKQSEEWLLKWYFNFDSQRGISFHEYELPGYPASHACVRLLSADAEWLYSWARQWRLSPDGRSIAGFGTPVEVFGTYELKHRRPWKRMVEDPAAARVRATELDSALAPHLALIRARIRPDSG